MRDRPTPSALPPGHVSEEELRARETPEVLAARKEHDDIDRELYARAEEIGGDIGDLLTETFSRGLLLGQQQMRERMGQERRTCQVCGDSVEVKVHKAFVYCENCRRGMHEGKFLAFRAYQEASAQPTSDVKDGAQAWRDWYAKANNEGNVRSLEEIMADRAESEPTANVRPATPEETAEVRRLEEKYAMNAAVAAERSANGKVDEYREALERVAALTTDLMVYNMVADALCWARKINVRDLEPPMADASPELPVCDVCGEEDSDERIYGKVEVCRSCYASEEYRIEQLTYIIQSFLDGGQLESFVTQCDNAGLRPKQPTPHVKDEGDK